jgi:hypothetical protein
LGQPIRVQNPDSEGSAEGQPVSSAWRLVRYNDNTFGCFRLLN